MKQTTFKPCFPFSEAKAGDHRCYTRFNPTGNFNGNCGRDESTGEYLKCADEYVKTPNSLWSKLEPFQCWGYFCPKHMTQRFLKTVSVFFHPFCIGKIRQKYFSVIFVVLSLFYDSVIFVVFSEFYVSIIFGVFSEFDASVVIVVFSWFYVLVIFVVFPETWCVVCCSVQKETRNHFRVRIKPTPKPRWSATE